MSAVTPRPEPWYFRRRVELASLIGGIGFVFFLFTPVHAVRAFARLVGPEETIVRGAYVLLALLNLLSGALRIWAGGILGGARMMSVHVRDDELLTAGPYGHVRNPIYLSDILTLAGMGLVVPWPGTILVWLLQALIYPRLIAFEQERLLAQLGEPYRRFIDNVPRLGWRCTAYRPEKQSGAFSWREGLTNNFIYLPLIPGFVVCALTGVLWHGVAVGASGPVGWVLLHFWRNFKPGGLARRGRTDG